MLEKKLSPVYNTSDDLRISSRAALGALHALLYGFDSRSSRSFSVTLAALPDIVSLVIPMVSGSILSYELTLEASGVEKAMLGELRCRNGDLEISLGELSSENSEL